MGSFSFAFTNFIYFPQLNNYVNCAIIVISQLTYNQHTTVFGIMQIISKCGILPARMQKCTCIIANNSKFKEDHKNGKQSVQQDSHFLET